MCVEKKNYYEFEKKLSLIFKLVLRKKSVVIYKF